MAQKIAPAALRLKINRHFDAYWFADRMYDTLLHQTMQTKTFVQDIFKSLGTKTALSHVQATPNTVFIQSFFCSPRMLNRKMRRKVVRYAPTDSFSLTFAPYLTVNTQAHRNALFAFCIGAHTKTWQVLKKTGNMHVLLAHSFYLQQKQYQGVLHNEQMALYTLTKSLHTRSTVTKKTSQHTFPVKSGLDKTPRRSTRLEKNARPTKSRALTRYASHIESVLAAYFQKRVVWTPKKMRSLFSSATFVAHYIALQFEQNKKKPFRVIFRDVIKQCTKNASLAGIRIACAGRLGGAEMARVESTHYGQTSLHVFTHKIDYHATPAYTSHGLFGIKVWMSFKK
jgi:ribosomal protein S3